MTGFSILRLPAKRLWVVSLFAVVLFALMCAGCARQSGPDALLKELDAAKAPGFVFDFARVINSADRAAIERTLSLIEASTGAEVKVVTLPYLRGGDVNDFANKLFERWGIGKKGEDNGVLILASIEDRRTRIEVGYGLEPVITDAAAGRILDQQVLPAFRRNDYSGGLRAGAEAVAAALGVGTASPHPLAAPDQSEKSILDRIVQLIIFIIVVAFIIRHPFLALMLLGGGRGGGSRGGFGGGGFGGGGFGGGLSGGGGASRGW